jgi:C1A family cysteine protease
MATEEEREVIPFNELVFSCVPDTIDSRDHLMGNAVADQSLPNKFDVRSLVGNSDPMVYNQRRLGSCTANAVGYAYAFLTIRQRNRYQIDCPSRLFLYYNTRALAGNVNKDSGASIRDTLKSAQKTGICREQMWSYLIFNYTRQPPQECYDEGKLCHGLEYISIPRGVLNLKTVLKSGYPVVMGFAIYPSFEKVMLTGLMTLPDTIKEKVLGHHAVVAVAYDDTHECHEGTKGAFLIRNSWGLLWGRGGYFYMPYTAIENPNVTQSFWYLTGVTDPTSLKKTSCCVIN